MEDVDRERAFILLITGPAGAGKSALADAWASAQARPTAHISLDDIRELVRSGYADPQHGWTPEAARQHRIARSLCADMARRYVAEDFSCVIDDAIFPLWEEVDDSAWRNVLGDTPTYLIVLLPTYETVAERNALRSGRRLLEHPMLRTIYDMMLPWRQRLDIPIIDTTSLTIAETVSEVGRRLDYLHER